MDRTGVLKLIDNEQLQSVAQLVRNFRYAQHIERTVNHVDVVDQATLRLPRRIRPQTNARRLENEAYEVDQLSAQTRVNQVTEGRFRDWLHERQSSLGWLEPRQARPIAPTESVFPEIT